MSAEELGQLVTQAGAWVWQTSVAAAFVAAFVAVVQFVFRNVMTARLRLALWWLVVVRLVVPAPLPSPYSFWSLWTSPPPLRPQVEVAFRSTPEAANTEAANIPSTRTPAAGFVSAESLDWTILASCVWLLGAVTWLAIVIVQQRKLSRWIRHEPAIDDFRETLEDAVSRSGVRRNVRVVECGLIGAPAVFGIRQPCILISRHLRQALNREQLRVVILHELAHIKRLDVLQNWLLIVLQSAHWFNPAIWLAFRQLRAAREIVCDAAVLAHLGSEERTLYGQTLIQIASEAMPTRAAQVLIPILNRKKHIERRVRMIAKFKPASRMAIVASAVVVALVAWVTLTGAADRPVPSKGPETAETVRFRNGLPSDSADEKARGLALMRDELQRLDAAIQSKWAEVDGLRRELRISTVEESGHTDPEPLRRLESLRADQAAEHQKLDSLYVGLKGMPRAELLSAIAAVSPDPLLTGLLEQRANAEQRYAAAIDNYGNDHPEVKGVRRTLKQIETQIDKRMDGVIEGLKVRAKTAERSSEHLAKTIAEAREAEIEQATRSRPYFRAKRELENLESVYDELHKRVMQAQIDAAIAPRAQPK